MSVYLVILASVFATSLLSGILGMAGGMILMAILVTTLSVANAMMLHGAVQATANGARAVLLRHHIKWHLLPPYTLGAAVSVALFATLALVPDAGVVLILVGLFPWLGLISERLRAVVSNSHPARATARVTTCTSASASMSSPSGTTCRTSRRRATT